MGGNTNRLANSVKIKGKEKKNIIDFHKSLICGKIKLYLNPAKISVRNFNKR